MKNRSRRPTSSKKSSLRRLVRWSLPSILFLCCLTALGAGGRLFSRLIPLADAARQQPGGAAPQGLSQSAVEQIQALIEEKQSWTPEQRKIDSQLLFEIKMQRGEEIAPGVPTLETKVEMDNQDQTVVDITAQIGGHLLEDLEAAGARILDVAPNYNSIRARVSLDQLETIAAFPEVSFIQPKQEGVTERSAGGENKLAGSRGGRPLTPDFSDRAARVRAYLATSLPKPAAAAPDGDLVAEGDVAHKGVVARTTFGMNGTGVKIGVLSDGVTNLKESQALGALGQVTVLPGQTGAGDEGTAMLEIIHALAPGAQLLFATAGSGTARFAQNIRDLRAAGADVIVDDFRYFQETPFQDGQALGLVSPTNGGLVHQAVNDVTAAGALYFASAGNEGNIDSNTGGVWEGDFKDGGAATQPLPSFAGRVHDFGGRSLFDTITSATSRSVTLTWSDPLGASANDYDLYILNSTGTTLLAASINGQSGQQDPFEGVGPQPAGVRVVIARFAGADRFLHLNTHRGRLAIATAGASEGHNIAANAFAVAATPAVGPFPNFFNSSNRVETFESDGPRRLFFRADGSPFTPGNFSSTGGLVRQKPDLTAADGVSVTGVGNFGSPFFGTSAAAPHAAAIAALLKSVNPNLTNAQIREALIRTAIDIQAPGVDRNSGAGIITVLEAAQFLGATPMADLDLGAVSATEDRGNGNGFIEPGEDGRLSIQLKNLGVVNAAGVTATLSSATPGVFINLPNTVSFADLPARTGAAVNATPLTFSLSTISTCNLVAILTLTVNYAGGPSPKVFTVEVPTGPPPISIATTLDATAPAPGPNFTTATGLQSPRLNRDGLTSFCASPKSFPGVFSTGTRRYDAYTFATCPGQGAPTCITVTLTNACTGGNSALFAAAFLDSFDPNNLVTNYLADAGFSNTTGEAQSFSFRVPSGRSFVIVVNEVNSDAGLGCKYNLTVSGLCQSCAGANLVCLQDDRSRDFLLFNSFTGDYLFTSCATGATLTGRGRIGKSGCLVTLSDGPRVTASLDNCPIGPLNRGNAVVRTNQLGQTLTISDSGLANNTCACP